MVLAVEACVVMKNKGYITEIIIESVQLLVANEPNQRLPLLARML
jgi:hypothetical protein